jgi:hypothetical protein
MRGGICDDLIVGELTPLLRAGEFNKNVLSLGWPIDSIFTADLHLMALPEKLIERGRHDQRREYTHQHFHADYNHL